MPLAAFPKCYLDQLCVTGEMTTEQWVDLSAELDVDGLEFYWGFTPWQDPARLDRIRRQVEDQIRIGRTNAIDFYNLPIETKVEAEAAA